VRIQSQAWLAVTLGTLGSFAEGRRYGEEALRLATLEGRGSTPIVAHACLGLLYLDKGDLGHAIRVCSQGLALCRASGHRLWSIAMVAGLGYAYVLLERLAEGYSLVEEAIREEDGVLNVDISHLYKLTSLCFKRGKISRLSRHLHF
jgi:hypothetical protein